MSFVHLERHDDVAAITMSRGKANALNTEMVAELNAAFAQAEGDRDVRAIVLGSDRPRFFSSGFDATEVFHYDRASMRAFWMQYNETLERLFRMPKPTIAAVPGHAFAGGALLCMACDVRLFAEGDYGFAISGINIGIALPRGVMQIAIHAMGVHRAKHLFLTGVTIAPAQALASGLAHEIHPEGEIARVALERASGLAKKAPTAYAQIKARYGVLDAPEHPDSDDLEAFLDRWFSDESRAERDKLLKKLKD